MVARMLGLVVGCFVLGLGLVRLVEVSNSLVVSFD